jgi:hypothetical protein
MALPGLLGRAAVVVTVTEETRKALRGRIREQQRNSHLERGPDAGWHCSRCGGQEAIVETSPADVRTTCLEPGCGHWDAYNLDTVATGPEADLLWQELARARDDRARAHREFWGLTDTNEEGNR